MILRSLAFQSLLSPLFSIFMVRYTAPQWSFASLRQLEMSQVRKIYQSNQGQKFPKCCRSIPSVHPNNFTSRTSSKSFSTWKNPGTESQPRRFYQGKSTFEALKRWKFKVDFSDSIKKVADVFNDTVDVHKKNAPICSQIFRHLYCLNHSASRINGMSGNTFIVIRTLGIRVPACL